LRDSSIDFGRGPSHWEADDHVYSLRHRVGHRARPPGRPDGPVVVGSDGRVWTTWWRDDNGRWASWYGVGGSQAFALPFVPTTSPAFGPERALTQRPSTMENGRWIVSPLVEQYSLDPRLSPLPAIAVLSETIAPAGAVRGETFWVLVAVHFFQAAPSYLLSGEHSFGILIRTPPQTVIPTGARVEYRHLNEDGTATAFDGSVLAFPGGTMRPTSRDDWWYIDCPDRDLFPPGWRVGRGRKMEIAVPLQATASANVAAISAGEGYLHLG